jgi:hypothetical protein
MFSELLQCVGMWVSSLEPSPRGPRQQGQFSAPAALAANPRAPTIGNAASTIRRMFAEILTAEPFLESTEAGAWAIDR